MRELRKSNSEPTLVALKKLLDDNLAKVNPTGPAGKAIKYALKRWPALLAYLSDGRIPIDNNLVENMIRPFVVGRQIENGGLTLTLESHCFHRLIWGIKLPLKWNCFHNCQFHFISCYIDKKIPL